MSEGADDRLAQVQRLRDQLASLNPGQTANYTQWIQHAQDDGPPLDVKHCLDIATTIAKDLPRHLQADEIKRTLARATADQHARDMRRRLEAEQSKAQEDSQQRAQQQNIQPTSPAPDRPPPHRLIQTPIGIVGGGMLDQQDLAFQMLRAHHAQHGLVPGQGRPVTGHEAADRPREKPEYRPELRNEFHAAAKEVTGRPPKRPSGSGPERTPPDDRSPPDRHPPAAGARAAILGGNFADPGVDRGQREELARRQQAENDKSQSLDPAVKAERKATNQGRPPAAGETKPVDRGERFTPREYRPPDDRGPSHDRGGRGGRGGRSR